MLEFKDKVVFVFHNGSQVYFRNALKSIIKQGLKVIHIGNTEVVMNGMISIQMPITDFEKYYVHMSFNGYNNELVCFERWFAIKIVAEKWGLSHFWHLDSDVALTKEWKNFAQEVEQSGELFLVSKDGQDFSAHVSYWTLNALTSFCTFIMSSYSPKIDNDLLIKWERHQTKRLPGGVCDMTLLKNWVKTKRIDVIFKIPNFYVQDNMNIVAENKLFLEDLKISKNSVYSGEGMILPFIHCQGRAKWLLRFRSFFSLRVSYFCLKCLYFVIRVLF